nr:hypothetical protein [Pseudorhodobacter antarcticus]
MVAPHSGTPIIRLLEKVVKVLGSVKGIICWIYHLLQTIEVCAVPMKIKLKTANIDIARASTKQSLDV